MDLLPPPVLEDVADVLAEEGWGNGGDTELERQRERVAAARAAKARAEAVNTDIVKGDRVVSNSSGGHRMVQSHLAEKYPNANWEQRPASFHDREDLKERLRATKEEKRRIKEAMNELNRRLSDSKNAVDRLLEKKRQLTYAKELKDFKVDLSVGDSGRDGWLQVPEPRKDDEIGKMVNLMEMRIINKEMAKGMDGIEAYAADREREAEDAEARLARRKDKLARFPVKIIQNLPEVQRQAIALVEEKAALERERDDAKRKCNMKLSDARADLSKVRDAVADCADDLFAVREDLKYWKGRLKVEKVKIGPMEAQFEAQKRLLDAMSAQHDVDGWRGMVVKAAFLQGCNRDFTTSTAVDTVKWDELVDRIYLRRIPEIVRAHMYPSIGSVSMSELQGVCDKLVVWYDEDDFGGSKVGFDDFYRIVAELEEKRVREMEKGEDVGGGAGGSVATESREEGVNDM